jgi:xylulokinase
VTGSEPAPEAGAHILGVDLGTSGVKVGLFSRHGRLVASAMEPLAVTLFPGGGAEQDAEAWWTAVVRAAERMFDHSPVPAGAVGGLGVSSQWSGTVAVGPGGDAPLTNALIWMDSRGAPQIERITTGFPKLEGYAGGKLAAWIRKSGGAPGHSGKDPVAHILWIRDELPAVYRQTSLFLEPKDWLNYRLTGRAAASFDSITLHWVTDTRDIANVRYDERLLRMSTLERSKLPDLVPPATIVGTMTARAARDLGVPDGVRVVSGAGDIFTAAIGSGAVRDFDAHLCLGTSSWLICHVPYKKTDVFHNMASVPSAIPGRYLLANEQECAGMCLTTLKDNIFFADDELGSGSPPGDVFQRLFRIAERIPPGSDGLVFAPWLNGERAPVDDRTVRGGFFNQSLETTRAHLVRAVLEGVACNSRWLLKYVERFIERPLDAITAVGGGARSDLWCQIHADVLNRPIRQVRDPVFANARGAAVQAAVALGYLRWDDVPAIVPVTRTFEPDRANRATYDRLFEAFLAVYKSSKRLAIQLNR